MLMYPPSYFFFFLIIMSIYMVISCDSWFVLWVGLEINLMSIVPLMKKNSTYSVESSSLYFLIQALSSYVIIMTYFFNPIKPFIFFIFISLMLKMGLAPLHLWVPVVFSGLSWQMIFIFLTLQKINPMLLISFLMFNSTLFYIFWFFIALSLLTGSIGALMQMSLKKIIAYSSIHQTSWLMISILLMKKTCVTYFMLYSLVNITIIYLLNSWQLFTLSQLIFSPANIKSFSFSVVMMLSLMNLTGLPPLTGFLPKFFIIKEMVNISVFFTFIMIVSILISLFFYLRLIFIKMMFMVSTPFTKNKNILVTLLTTMIISFAPSAMFITLNFKLYKLKPSKLSKSSS